MNIELVTSREYKVMLKPGMFAVKRQNVVDRCNDFWSDFSKSISDSVVKVSGKFDEIKHERRISFLDTPDKLLRKNSYVFRIRRENDSQADESEVTLKFRSPDRYISQDRDLAGVKKRTNKLKFEEDIKSLGEVSPFYTLYSYSSKQDKVPLVKLKKLKDITKIYPFLKDKLWLDNRSSKLETVGEFQAAETVIAGPKFRIAENPKIDCEYACILWREPDTDEEQPLVAEFSFRYGSRHGIYSQAEAIRAYRAFVSLTRNLSGWVAGESPTKTAYAYMQLSKRPKNKP